MSFLQLDGFDAYKIGDVNAIGGWNGSPFGSGTTGRFGDGTAITVISLNEIWQSMDPSIVGFAFRNNSDPGWFGAGGPICYRLRWMPSCGDLAHVCPGSPYILNFKVGIGLDAANSPYVFTTTWADAGACPGHPDKCDLWVPGTTIYYGWGETPHLDYDQWNYLEIDFDTLELRLNGETVVTSASTQTSHGTNFSSSGIQDDRLYIQVPTPNSGIDVDDFYAQDSGGGFLGDVHIKTLYPTADGHYVDWIPDTGTAHYSRVNETPCDGDASYVRDPNPGNRDSYLMQAMSLASGTIFATQLNLAASIGHGLSQAVFEPFIRQAGVDHDGPSLTLSAADSTGTGYWLARFVSDTDPTGSTWTVSTVNGDEYGIRLVSAVPD